MIVNLAGSINNACLQDIFQAFLVGLDDYTVDSRGDIGAIVRESAMSSLKVNDDQSTLLTITPLPSLLERRRRW